MKRILFVHERGNGGMVAGQDGVGEHVIRRWIKRIFTCIWDRGELKGKEEGEHVIRSCLEGNLCVYGRGGCEERKKKGGVIMH
jgi:hypothetical protein